MTDQRVQLAPEIRATLAALRRRIRRYVWLEGLSARNRLAGSRLLGEPGDRLVFRAFHRPAPLAVVGILAGLAAVVATLILRRLVVPLRDSSMALLLERRYPEFRDSLLTAVELAEPQRAADPYDPTLLRAGPSTRPAAPGPRAARLHLQPPPLAAPRSDRPRPDPLPSRLCPRPARAGGRVGTANLRAEQRTLAPLRAIGDRRLRGRHHQGRQGNRSRHRRACRSRHAAGSGRRRDPIPRRRAQADEPRRDRRSRARPLPAVLLHLPRTARPGHLRRRRRR